MALEYGNLGAIAHYRDKYDAKYPIWVVIGIMSFGMISKLYNNMPTVDQKYLLRRSSL
ncbi:Abi family protein [Paenibacillus provencensis]|uniref:Abi family protein n=1 Tax=Paenibacillus provencensis TaxID=441151 RepID=A0ABW3Q9F2_9BACL